MQGKASMVFFAFKAIISLTCLLLVVSNTSAYLMLGGGMILVTQTLAQTVVLGVLVCVFSLWLFASLHKLNVNEGVASLIKSLYSLLFVAFFALSVVLLLGLIFWPYS